MSDEPIIEKLKMHTRDFVDANVQKLAELFPNCVTEATGENGKIKAAIDFDLLRQELSEDLIEGPHERYRLDWPGKKAAWALANKPISKTLRPVIDESEGFETTSNIFIEGENLDSLKLLQENYLGKIKMIYIDPPYNTGKDFIFKDDFSLSKEEYYKATEQFDIDRNCLTANPEASGRFRSDWLSMIYSRLKLSRNLLTDDGVIFISNNDHEAANLKTICNEIFGAGNFLAQLVWKTDGNFDNQAKFKTCHEYIFVYARAEESFPHPPVVDRGIPKSSKLFNTHIRNTVIKNGPKNPVKRVTIPIGFPASFPSGVLQKSCITWPQYNQDIVVVDGIISEELIASTGWSSKDLLEDFINSGFEPVRDSKGQETTFEITKTGAIEAIKKRSEFQSHVISTLSGLGGSQKATQELEDLEVIFDDYPKPVDLITYLIEMNHSDDFIVLDFFAGSNTTAEAVFQANLKDGGTRSFISVQTDEPCPEGSKALEAGFNTISEISLERVRKAGKKIKNVSAHSTDIGFRVMKVDSSNMADVYYQPDKVAQQDLFEHIDNIKPDRTHEDLLFQVLLDWGLELSLPIETETINDHSVFFVDDNALAACFETSISEDLVREIAKHKPLRVVFRDSGFADDSTKINVVQIFKQLSPETEVRSI